MKTIRLRASNRAMGMKLMAQTRGRRRQWIMDDKPNVTDIIDAFPLLKDPIIVSID